MTICIAAICDNGAYIVVGVDQMFTIGPPLNVEFEPSLSKIDPLGFGCVALASGNSLFANELIRRVNSKLASGKIFPIMDIANVTKEEYALLRDEKIEENVIRANFGQDLISFRMKGGFLPGYLQPQPGIYQQIVVQVNQFNLNLELIVSGVDSVGGHIFCVGHPGTLANFDKLGYAAIGSGAIHAVVSLSLGGQTPKSSLAETLYSVYSGKRSAEVAPGVGKETEIAVICKEGTSPATKPLLAELEKAYNERIQKVAPDLSQVAKVYDEQRKSA
jgi:hypothetical protein